MSPEPSPILVRLVELLEYGGEVGVEKEALIRQAGLVIPPGRAIREAERTRRKAGGIKRQTPEQRAIPRSDDRLIQAGRRALVMAALHTHRTYLERYADANGIEWVRLLSVPPGVLSHRANSATITDTANPEERQEWPNA